MTVSDVDDYLNNLSSNVGKNLKEEIEATKKELRKAFPRNRLTTSMSKIEAGLLKKIKSMGKRWELSTQRTFELAGGAAPSLEDKDD